MSPSNILAKKSAREWSRRVLMNKGPEKLFKRRSQHGLSTVIWAIMTYLDSRSGLT
jgi:hypothetical protein